MNTMNFARTLSLPRSVALAAMLLLVALMFTPPPRFRG